MNAAISKTLSRLLTSKRVRDLRRTRAALTRRLRKAQPTVHYFHQDDDPYSVLAVQLLPALAERYAVAIRILRVSPPSAAAAPDARVCASTRCATRRCLPATTNSPMRTQCQAS